MSRLRNAAELVGIVLVFSVFAAMKVIARIEDECASGEGW